MCVVTVVAALGVLDDRHRFSAMREMALLLLPEIDLLYAATFHRTHDLHWSVVRFILIDIRHLQAENTYFRLPQYPFRC